MDRRAFMLATPAAVLAGCVSVPGDPGPPAPAPVFRVGDRWVYRCADGFRMPVTWVETHEVVAVGAQGIDVRISLRGGGGDYDRMERLVSPGVVRSGAVYDPVETRQFEEPLIRYQFPLTPGASWSQNLRNVDPANGLVSTVNRFVRVGGWQQVSVPAGTFDAIVMRILMSVDDNHPFRFPTNANYVVWWSPQAGAAVRETRVATYRERGDGREAIEIRAQNTTIELESFARAPA
ncbi:MAG: hypothetical protein IT517_00915 [Burkholderiales bacterium]|nr:hypothetical protein [Burkholderiales bacterium]